jgi:predicted transporter
MLLIATLLAVGTGIAYLMQWQSGQRGPDLLGFVAIYLTLPLCLSIAFLFAYLKAPSR